jgi:ABC-2 type transport system ATP-binding protein
MRGLAAEGRTVFVSSHLMSEMENTADHLIVIGKGKLIADCSMAEFIARSSGQSVLVRTPQPDALAKLVAAAGGTVEAGSRPAELRVHGFTQERVGDVAFAGGIRLHHLAPARASLEHAFMELTADSVEYQAGLVNGRQPAHSGTNATEGLS